MNAHRGKPDSPAALVELATDVVRRVHRIAVKAGPEGRLRLMGELSLTATVLDQLEYTVLVATQGELKEIDALIEQLTACKRTKQLPKGRRRALLPFQGGRGLPQPRALPTPRKRRTA